MVDQKLEDFWKRQDAKAKAKAIATAIATEEALKNFVDSLVLKAMDDINKKLQKKEKTFGIKAYVTNLKYDMHKANLKKG